MKMNLKKALLLLTLSGICFPAQALIPLEESTWESSLKLDTSLFMFSDLQVVENIKKGQEIADSITKEGTSTLQQSALGYANLDNFYGKFFDFSKTSSLGGLVDTSGPADLSGALQKAGELGNAQSIVEAKLGAAKSQVEAAAKKSTADLAKMTTKEQVQYAEGQAKPNAAGQTQVGIPMPSEKAGIAYVEKTFFIQPAQEGDLNAPGYTQELDRTRDIRVKYMKETSLAAYEFSAQLKTEESRKELEKKISSVQEMIASAKNETDTMAAETLALQAVAGELIKRIIADTHIFELSVAKGLYGSDTKLLEQPVDPKEKDKKG